MKPILPLKPVTPSHGPGNAGAFPGEDLEGGGFINLAIIFFCNMFKGTVHCLHGRKVTLKELSLDTMADQRYL